MRELRRHPRDLALVVIAIGAILASASVHLLPLLGTKLVVIAGHSMEPTIPFGAMVLAQPAAPSDLEIGDVVTIQAGPGRALVTHRIDRTVQRSDGAWLSLKGDANFEADPVLVPATSVVGRVVLAVPTFGRLLRVLASPGGLLTVVGVAGCLIAWLMLGPVRPRRRAAGGLA